MLFLRENTIHGNAQAHTCSVCKIHYQQISQNSPRIKGYTRIYEMACRGQQKQTKGISKHWGFVCAY